MGMSTSVRLPKHVVPTFPDRCIYSGDPMPDTQAVIVASAQNPLLSFLSPVLLLFSWRRIRVPIARPYLARFYFQNFGRDIIMISIVLAGIFVFMPMLGRHDPLRKFKVAGLVLTTLMPWVLFEVFWPRRFDATVGGTWIDYEFASAEYASEFALLNAGHVLQVH